MSCTRERKEDPLQLLSAATGRRRLQRKEREQKIAGKLLGKIAASRVDIPTVLRSDTCIKVAEKLHDKKLICS